MVWGSHRRIVLGLLWVIGNFISGSSEAALMAVGDGFTCAWDGRASSEIRCKGRNEDGQTEAPISIRSPFEIGAGSLGGCALHYEAASPNERRISCWGDKNKRQSFAEVPSTIVRPIALSVGLYHSCALHEPQPGKTAASCWGRNDSGQSTAPLDLDNPTAIYASTSRSFHYSCALHANASKVRCWGMVALEAPAAMFPGLASGLPLVCQPVGRTDVNCWSNRYHFNSPQVLAVGPNLTCRLSGQEVNCQSSLGHPHPIPYKFKNPKDVAVSPTHVCVLDEEAPKCWGCMEDETACQRIPGLHLGPSFENLGETRSFLQLLSEFVYDYDAEFLKGVNVLLEDLNDDRAVTFVIGSLRPFFVDFGYRSVKTEYVNRAIYTLDRLVADSEKKPPLDKLVRTRLAISLLVMSIKTSLKLVTPKDKATARQIISELGAARSAGEIPPTTSQALLQFYRSVAANSYLTGRIILGQALLGAIQKM